MTAFAAFRTKGKGKGKFGRLRPSNVSLQDRRQIMAEMKARSHCRKCGRRGHWEGDADCPMKGSVASPPKPHPQQKPFKKKGYMAVTTTEGPIGFLGIPDRAEEDSEKTCNMGLRGEEGVPPPPKAAAARPLRPQSRMVSFPDNSSEWEQVPTSSSAAASTPSLPNGHDTRFHSGMYSGKPITKY